MTPMDSKATLNKIIILCFIFMILPFSVCLIEYPTGRIFFMDIERIRQGAGSILAPEKKIHRNKG
jgi:hypothetical protein